jgi:hypothetical protein
LPDLDRTNYHTKIERKMPRLTLVSPGIGATRHTLLLLSVLITLLLPTLG